MPCPGDLSIKPTRISNQNTGKERNIQKRTTPIPHSLPRRKISTRSTRSFPLLQMLNRQHDAHQPWLHRHPTGRPHGKHPAQDLPIFRLCSHSSRCNHHLLRQQYDPCRVQRRLLPIKIQGPHTGWRPLLPLKQLHQYSQQWSCFSPLHISSKQSFHPLPRQNFAPSA